MKIYENIIIGNFLFGLGYRIGSKNTDLSFTSHINLLQQTPADKLLGDLMAKLGNKVYLIEFKEAKNRSNKELIRHKMLEDILKDEQYYDLLSISKKIHWYIETSVTQDDLNNHTLVSRIGPYVEMNSLPEHQPNVFNKFIEYIASDVSNGSDDYTPKDAERYLNIVRKTLGNDEKYGSGGLLLSINPKGEIHYVVMKDIIDLSKDYKDWRNSLQQEWKEKELEIKHQHIIRYRREIERDEPSFER